MLRSRDFEVKISLLYGVILRTIRNLSTSGSSLKFSSLPADAIEDSPFLTTSSRAWPGKYFYNRGLDFRFEASQTLLPAPVGLSLAFLIWKMYGSRALVWGSNSIEMQGRKGRERKNRIHGTGYYGLRHGG